MPSYAQTNTQLFNQLCREGYSDQEILRVRNAYEFAIALFSGLYQPSGKPFLDHAVGTASVLVTLHQSTEIIAAGLLHSAYALGNFGSSGRGISAAKRRQVRQAAGEQVEEYVAKYSALSWDRRTIPYMHANLDALSPFDREVLLIRLANTLESYLDCGGLYCFNADYYYRRLIEYYGALIIEMADKLDFPLLATELGRVFRETTEVEVSVELRNRRKPVDAYLIAPRSSRERLSVTVGHYLHRQRWLQCVLQKAAPLLRRYPRPKSG